MINAIAAYIVSWGVIFFFKFIGMFTGVTFLVSPDSLMYSTIVYFTLFYFIFLIKNSIQRKMTQPLT